MLREAFLPPVTVEELDALRATNSANRRRTTTRVAGTRGWYDHAFEAMNFLIPLLVTLMFIGIQAVVLMLGADTPGN